MIDIEKIQVEHINWQVKNFGHTRTPEHSLLGIMEELGELSHAYMKKEEGIRLNENHKENMKDAVGDITIFLLSFCSSQKFNLEQIIYDTWKKVSKRDWKKYPKTGRPE